MSVFTTTILFNRCAELLNKLDERDSYCAAKMAKFDNVNPTLSALAFAYE